MLIDRADDGGKVGGPRTRDGQSQSRNKDDDVFSHRLIGPRRLYFLTVAAGGGMCFPGL